MYGIFLFVCFLYFFLSCFICSYLPLSLGSFNLSFASCTHLDVLKLILAEFCKEKRNLWCQAQSDDIHEASVMSMHACAHISDNESSMDKQSRVLKAYCNRKHGSDRKQLGLWKVKGCGFRQVVHKYNNIMEHCSLRIWTKGIIPLSSPIG